MLLLCGGRGHSPSALLLRLLRWRTPGSLLWLLPGGHSPSALLLRGACIPATWLAAPALLTGLAGARLPLPVIHAGRRSGALFLAAAAEKEQRDPKDDHRDNQHRCRDDKRLFVDRRGCPKNACQCTQCEKLSHIVHLSSL